MFGMGFMEIFLIAIVAVIALGPDKLPTAMVEVAKFFKKFKSGVEEAKTTLNDELNVTEMRNEANKLRAQIEDTKSSLSMDAKVDLGLDEILNDDLAPKNNLEKPKEKKKAKKDKKKESEQKQVEGSTEKNNTDKKEEDA